MDLENAYDKIYRYVYFRIKNRTVAEDITQETFLRFISQKGNIHDYEMKYLKNLTGKLPAIRGFDFASYCPCYAWDDGVANRMIDWAKNKNGIVTASWHINVPTNKADYTLGEPLDFSKTTYSEKTDFVTANCMVKGTM